jgi:periplasmic divalent cation tolerance protein
MALVRALVPGSASGMSSAILVYSTCPDAATAERIGRHLVGEGLCACVNIIPGMRAIYRWQGAVETADEVVLIIKTVTGRAEAVGQRLRQLHPYTEPCELRIPVSGGSESYQDRNPLWIIDLRAPPDGPTGPPPPAVRA